MAWLPNIPQPNDQLDQSQPQILANFQALDVLFANNRMPNNQLFFNEIGANPTTAVDQVALYAKLGTASTVAELFLRKENNGDVLNLSELFQSYTSSQNNDQSFTLPAGIIVKFGNHQTPGTAAATFTYPTAFPNTAYSCFLMASRLAGGLEDRFARLDTFNLTGFTVQGLVFSTAEVAQVRFSYLAIGD